MTSCRLSAWGNKVELVWKGLNAPLGSVPMPVGTVPVSTPPLWLSVKATGRWVNFCRWRPIPPSEPKKADSVGKFSHWKALVWFAGRFSVSGGPAGAICGVIGPGTR